MRVALMVSISLLLASECRAGATHPCIPKATDALPRTAGLMVKQTRVRPASAVILSTWKGQSRPIIVDVDFVVAGKSNIRSSAWSPKEQRSCNVRSIELCPVSKVTGRKSPSRQVIRHR